MAHGDSVMTGQNQGRLGIVAGRGVLPSLLINACKKQHRSYTLIGLQGLARIDELGEDPKIWMRLGEAAKGFDQLRRDGVQSVVLAGKVERPSLKNLMPDWRTVKFLTRVGKRAFTDQHSTGDDKLLRAVIAEIEDEGFTIEGVESVCPELIAKLGTIGRIQPSDADMKDVAVGFKAAKDLGQKDIGQAVVVQHGEIICQETETGTDRLIATAGSVKIDGLGPVLVKTAKPQQDRRVDLPAIGPETVAACYAAGFRGIAVEAGSTLVLEHLVVAEAADAKGIYIVAVDGSEGAS